MPDKEQTTVGIHPKVKLPLAALTLIGAVLVALGFILGDDTLKKEGLSVVGAGGTGGVFGFIAPLAVTTGGGTTEPTEAQDATLPNL